MPRHDNQKEVKEFLDANPDGATLEQIKGVFANREKPVNTKKVLDEMVKNGKVVVINNNGVELYKNNATNKNKKTKITKTNKSKTANDRSMLDYSEMIDADNNGRFNELKTELELEVKNDYLVALTKENAKKIELKLKEDGAYYPYVESLCQSINFKKHKKLRYDWKTVLGIVRLIDWENSTQQWDNGNIGRKRLLKMVEYITNKESNFWDDLIKGRLKLVDDLVDAAVSGEENNNGDGPKSLASKVCKYLSYFAFKNDTYYVNDKFVRKVLPYYLDYYLGKRVSKVDKAPYIQLHVWLKLIHLSKRVASEKLSKNDLDHIMWYSYKNSKGVFH